MKKLPFYIVTALHTEAQISKDIVQKRPFVASQLKLDIYWSRSGSSGKLWEQMARRAGSD